MSRWGENRQEKATAVTRHIGTQVRSLRRHLGMTQEDVAAVVRRTVPGFRQVRVMAIETFQREHVTVDELLGLAEALRVPATWLLPNQPEIPRSDRLLEMARYLTELSKECAP